MARYVLQLVIVMLCSFGLSSAALARMTSVGPGSVQCCCGEHASDEPCGCPTCPAADEHEDEHVHAEHRLGPCGASAAVIEGKTLSTPPPLEEGEPPPFPKATCPDGPAPAWPQAPPQRPDAPDS